MTASRLTVDSTSLPRLQKKKDTHSGSPAAVVALGGMDPDGCPLMSPDTLTRVAQGAAWDPSPCLDPMSRTILKGHESPPLEDGP